MNNITSKTMALMKDAGLSPVDIKWDKEELRGVMDYFIYAYKQEEHFSVEGDINSMKRIAGLSAAIMDIQLILDEPE